MSWLVLRKAIASSTLFGYSICVLVLCFSDMYFLFPDLELANEENSLKYFEGKDAYFTCFGTTRGNAGSNVSFTYTLEIPRSCDI